VTAASGKSSEETISYRDLTWEPTMESSTEPAMTRVSTKGQVILPKAIRQRRDWHAGTRLIVEETKDGVLLRSAPVFPKTRPEDVYRSLRYAGPPKSLEEMEAGIAAEAKRRHAGGR
jgi:AbrB family looped-hinge helix DNA binding protein